MKAPFQKERKLDLEKLGDWPRKLREDAAAQKEKIADKCPYCSSKKVVKRGKRKKKLETVQLYLCRSCNKTFTPQKVKGKTFPLRTIIDGLSWYNLGYSLEQSCTFLKEHYGIEVSTQTLSNWLKEFEKLCRYSRMREFGLRLYTPNQVVQSVTLYHRQVYRYRYHRAKAELCLQEFRNSRLSPLKEFLDAVGAECPHQFFQEGVRASDSKAQFDLSQVVINERFNFAVRLAQLVLQAVNNNRERHEILQKFMLANDSVTVACEVPVWLDDEDVEHMQSALGFDVPDIFAVSRDDGNASQKLVSNAGSGAAVRKIITGHIDMLQIRNGSVHILDYKPGARREKPIEQLTIYALALSRLTGLRLFDFRCAWFDDRNYYEFFPLHVVYKKKKRLPKTQQRLDAIKADKFQED